MSRGRHGRRTIRRPETVDDLDEAFRDYSSPGQCGDCYSWYDIEKNEQCPRCGSRELVGMR